MSSIIESIENMFGTGEDAAESKKKSEKVKVTWNADGSNIPAEIQTALDSLIEACEE